MPIPVISNIVPQNDNPNFGVVKDTDMMGGWRAVADDAALLAIPTGRRIEGMRAWVRSTGQLFQLRGGTSNANWKEVTQFRNDSFILYVDPALGDDGNPGSAAYPIKSLHEATKRIPLLGDSITIWLKAGAHVVDQPNTVFHGADRVLVRGEKIVTSYQIDSTLYNAWKVSGSPGWTVDEHKGKVVHWNAGYGGFYYDYGGWIISNTVDTLLIGIGTTDRGGYRDPPLPGDTIDLTVNAARIVPTSYAATPHYAGNVQFQDVCFDGASAGVDSAFCVTGSSPADNAVFLSCNFVNWSTIYDVISPSGYLTVQNCFFKDFPDAIETDIWSYISDNLFMDGQRCVLVDFGYVDLNLYSTGFYIRCTGELISMGGNHVSLDDGSVLNWIDTCPYYALIHAGAKYIKSISPLLGWTGKDTFSQRVLYLYSQGASALLTSSQLSTLKPDASYFTTIGGINLSLANYVAGGKNAEFRQGICIQG